MTTDKIEGTILLEGLLQGRVPADPEFETKLRDWTGLMSRLGLKFSPEINAGQFSLLPDGDPVTTAALGDAPDQALQQAIEQFIDSFPKDQPVQVFSTLRSREYRKGEEIQTTYQVAGSAVKLNSRSLVASTTPPPQPVDVKTKMKIAGTGVAVTLVLFGLLMLIPGVRQMFFEVVESVKPFNSEEFSVQVGPYADYLKVVLDKDKTGGRGAMLHITRTGEYPANDEQLTAAAKAAENSVTKRLAIESLARGRVHIDLFDGNNKHVGSADVRVGDPIDAKKGHLEIYVPFPNNIRVNRLVFAP